ncbi:MAG: hypothetical protein KDA20_02370 [Phycisphaerales bacterium]|nr:hypothetical protein [Phycisphaerales bacterium]
MTAAATQRRRVALVGALGVIAALVLVDRLGGGEAMSQGSSTASAHRDLIELTAQEQALLAAAPQIVQARDTAKQQWEELASGLVQARTLELARSTVRQRLLDVLERDAAGSRVQPAPSVGNNEPGKSVQMIAQVVSFDAQTPEAAYALLDRLANMPNLRTRLTDLRMTGPGIREVKQSIQVRVTIETPALVTEVGHG